MVGGVVMAGGASPVQARSAATARVNDPLAPLQWHLRRDGLGQAWPQTVGGDVTVAIIDSGVDLGHPDLRSNLWTNAGEIAGNGADDDGNGFVDDVHGYDFVAGDGDPSDEHGHGTHVAGVLGARGNNAIGVSGVAQRARLMVLRVLDARNDGNTTWLASAIGYAVANGARVINVSLNTRTDDPQVAAAIERARVADVLVVVSAGNDGADLGAQPSYPACSPSPNVITVGAIGRSGRRSSFSNRGRCVDVTAPGEGIVATERGGGYESRSGTSMAAPQVAGVAVLALAAHPQATAAELAAAMTAQPVRSRARAAAAAGAPRISAARLLSRLR